MLIRIIFISLPMILLLSYGMYLWFFLVMTFFYIFNFLAIFGVLKNKRTNNQNKFIWILTLIFAPGIGAYIYYSTSRIPKKMKKKYVDSKLLESELVSPNVENSSIKILDSGDEKFRLLFSKLEKAKKYINIQYFIITDGIIFSKLEKILLNKIEEGVKVKILYDYIGSGLIDISYFKKLINAGAEVREFGKINWFQTNGSDNFRNHNKIVIIDGEIAFFGGINIADEYVMIDSYFGDWYDTHFLLKGKIVKELNGIFITHWFLETKINISNQFSYPKYNIDSSYKKMELLVDSPYKNRPIFYKELIQQINNSKLSIKIITPYVVIPTSLRAPIRKAISRGVNIEIITIGKEDKKSAYYVGGFELDTLNDIGVKIYRTKEIFSHTKMYLFDDKKVLFGTTNLDFRALYLHFETNIFLESTSLIDFSNHFNMYKEKSIIHSSSRREWSFGRIIMYVFIRFFKGLF